MKPRNSMEIRRGRPLFLFGLLCLLLCFWLFPSCSQASSKTVVLEYPAKSEPEAETGELELKLKKIYTVDAALENASEVVLEYAWDDDDPTKLLILKATDEHTIKVLRMDYRYGFYDTIFTYYSKRLLYATLSPDGRTLVYAEYSSEDEPPAPEPSTEGETDVISESAMAIEVDFTRYDLTSGERKTFAMEGMSPSEWNNPVNPDTLSAAYSDMSGCWSDSGNALAVWMTPGSYPKDADVSVINFSTMRSRSCLVPFIDRVSAVNNEGNALIVSQYGDPFGKNEPDSFYYMLSEREEGMYELLYQTANPWFAFDHQGGIWYHWANTLRRCTLDDIQKRSKAYDCITELLFDEFNDALSPTILQKNISVHNSCLSFTENGESYIAFAVDYCDVYISQIQDNRLVNPRLLYKGDYGSFRIKLSRDASRLLIEETSGFNRLSKKYPLVLELE